MTALRELLAPGYSCAPCADASLERHQQFRVIDPECEIRLRGALAFQKNQERLVENELPRLLRLLRCISHISTLGFQDGAVFVQAETDVLQRQDDWNPLERAGVVIGLPLQVRHMLCHKSKLRIGTTTDSSDSSVCSAIAL